MGARVSVCADAVVIGAAEVVVRGGGEPLHTVA